MSPTAEMKMKRLARENAELKAKFRTLILTLDTMKGKTEKLYGVQLEMQENIVSLLKDLG